MAPIRDSDSDSLFHLERVSQWVSLPPASLADPLPAVCASIFSPLLLSYYPPARGIVLAWQDVELSDAPPTSSTPSNTNTANSKPQRRRKQQEDGESDSSGSEAEEEEDDGQPLLLKVIDEYSAPFLWATATFLVFRPKQNAWLEARITSQAATHITLSYLNAFSISVVRNHLPKDWTWSAASNGSSSTAGGKKEEAGATEGYWVDAEGNPVALEARVRIRDWDARAEGRGGRAFLNMEGSLVGEGEERGGEDGAERRKGKAKAKSALRAAKKTTEGEAMEIE